MTAVSLADLDALGRSLGGDRYDPFSQRALARAYEEFRSRGRSPLAPVVITADGTEYANLAAVLADPAAKFEKGELRLDPIPPAGPAWGFLRPFERLSFQPDGSVEVHPLEPGPPVRGIARVLLREHYQVRSQAEEESGAAGGARPEVRGLYGTIAEGLAGCRAGAIIPFGAAVLVYLPEERTRYEFDAIASTLLPDPRAGRLSPVRRARRSPRVAWALDQYLAGSDLSILGARCLEVLAESPGLTSIELSHVFGGVREIVDSALQGLVQHHLVTFDPRTGLYHARLEAFLEPTAAPAYRPEFGVSAADAALQTSVQELLTAADARATCPLCGAALPPGLTTILCAKCAEEVAAG